MTSILFPETKQALICNRIDFISFMCPVISYERPKVFHTQISIAPVRIFLHKSGEDVSGYFKTSDPFDHIIQPKDLVNIETVSIF